MQSAAEGLAQLFALYPPLDAVPAFVPAWLMAILAGSWVRKEPRATGFAECGLLAEPEWRQGWIYFAMLVWAATATWRSLGCFGWQGSTHGPDPQGIVFVGAYSLAAAGVSCLLIATASSIRGRSAWTLGLGSSRCLATRVTLLTVAFDVAFVLMVLQFYSDAPFGGLALPLVPFDAASPPVPPRP